MSDRPQLTQTGSTGASRKMYSVSAEAMKIRWFSGSPKRGGNIFKYLTRERMVRIGNVNKTNRL